MTYYSRIILNSFYNRLFLKLFRNNRRMPRYSITVLNTNLPQTSLVHETRKATVELTSKQLEYITKGHIAMQTIVF